MKCFCCPRNGKIRFPSFISSVVSNDGTLPLFIYGKANDGLVNANAHYLLSPDTGLGIDNVILCDVAIIYPVRWEQALEYTNDDIS